MSFSLRGLVDRVGNTVHNDVLQPLNRNIAQPFSKDVGAPVNRAVTGAVEAINPWDAESRGNNLINQANGQLDFTPQFKSVLDHANPVVSNAPISSSLLLGNHSAEGINNSADHYAQHGIQIQNTGDETDNNNTILHEGLHSVWNNYTPQQRSDFENILQANLGGHGQTNASQPLTAQDRADGVLSKTTEVPTLGDWLALRTQGYKNASSGIDNVNQLDPEIQNELHSFVPQYYQANDLVMPDSLKNYYSNFYGAKQPAPNNSTANKLKSLLGRVF